MRGSAGKPPAQIPVRLFSVKTHSCRIRRLQNRETNRHAVFLVLEDKALSYEYELDLRKAVTPAAGAAAEPLEPDPRVAHTLTLSFDDFGNAQQSHGATSACIGRRIGRKLRLVFTFHGAAGALFYLAGQ